jgi:hypothetical protein
MLSLVLLLFMVLLPGAEAAGVCDRAFYLETFGVESAGK